MIDVTVLGDRTRLRMLAALMDGRDLPASLLAAEAGVAASTASEHLSKLVDAGLVTVHPQGRHRYFRLRDSEVAALVESLSQFAPLPAPRSLKQGNRLAALREARTCYDHLAGRLGVSILAGLIERGAISVDDGGDVAYRLTPSGCTLLLDLGVDLPPHAAGTVPLRHCVDWTERTHHLSGLVGRALAARLFELGWIERNAVARSVRVTDRGRRGLRALQIDDRRSVDRLQRTHA